MWHRKLNSALALLAVVAAVACVVGTLAFFRSFDLQTTQLLEQRREAVERRTGKLKDYMRRVGKRMGFNILILPQKQELSELLLDATVSEYMPESYADKLANSPIMTVNHLLPCLEQRFRWTERRNRTIFLIGVKGQVPIAHRDPKKPIQDAVPKGEIVLGHELAETEQLGVGDPLALLGRTFTVREIRTRVGDKTDITVWIDLATAQEMFDKKDLINSIWALACGCAAKDLPKIRADVARFLPGTRVVEKWTKALARAEFRKAAADEAARALAFEVQARSELRHHHESLASLILPLVVMVMGIWVALLTVANAHQRRKEVGIFRALGWRSGQIMQVFLMKSATLGLAGAVVGCGVGFAVGGWFGASASKLFDGPVVLAIVVTAPVLTVFSALLPAMIAAQRDPAQVLGGD
ncbi:hypothetical protein CMO84_11745 [Candidatus Woesearchaeota archaeon]|nr:hypothetical protein [Candidatus Woesearchaeota archaeon]